jgi:hypothetical protein
VSLRSDCLLGLVGVRLQGRRPINAITGRKSLVRDAQLNFTQVDINEALGGTPVVEERLRTRRRHAPHRFRPFLAERRSRPSSASTGHPELGS